MLPPPSKNKGITSDLTLDASKFSPASVKEDTSEFNEFIEGITGEGPQWHEVGAAKFREMQEANETSLPAPRLLPAAKDGSLTSRDPGRSIPLRVYKPDNGWASKGLFLHIHGGGFVTGTHQHSDNILKAYANACQVTAISVGYRLAPEDPHPAAAHDCFDAADYLVDNAEKEYKTPLRFICGESAGGYLAARIALHLMRSRPAHKLAGVILSYGIYDFTLSLPSVISSARPIGLNKTMLQKYSDAYIPDMSPAEKRTAQVSPAYEDLQALASKSPNQSLPPALFICGTADPLIDDTLLMSMKWMVSGSEAVVKIYPGAAHGFSLFPGIEDAEEANAVAIQFVKEKLVSKG